MIFYACVSSISCDQRETTGDLGVYNDVIQKVTLANSTTHTELELTFDLLQCKVFMPTLPDASHKSI